MIQAIIRFSAENRFLVLLATAVAVGYGVYTLRHIPVDAIPDLSDTQVIVYSRWDRSPDIIEDQVTYPIVDAPARRAEGQGHPRLLRLRLLVRLRHLRGRHGHLLGAQPRARVPVEDPAAPARRACRPSSAPTPPAWAGSTSTPWWTRPGSTVPRRAAHVPGLEPALPPPVGARRGRGGLRRRLRPAVPGHRRPQPRSRPTTSRSPTWSEAIRASNNEVGGRLLEFGGTEYMVRGRGYAQVRRRTSRRSSSRPTRRGRRSWCATWRRSRLGPEIRRGVSDLDGQGDTVGGIVVMRHGENARERHRARARARSTEIEPSLPEGVRIVTTYDRSELIQRSIDTLKHELIVEMLIVSLVILLFLWHIPSAIVPILTIPISVLLAFIPMYLHGHLLEHHVARRHRHLHRRAGGRRHRRGGERLQEARAVDAGGRKGDFHAVRLEALMEVGPSVFFSLLVIAVAFLPGLHARGPGGAALQAAGLDQEPGHGHRRDPGHHARPGHADAVRADGLRSLPAALARLARQPGHGRHVLPRGEAPDQPRPLPRLRARLPLRCSSSRRPRSPSRSLLVADAPSRSTSASVTSSCRRSTRGRCSTCRRRCRASR